MEYVSPFDPRVHADEPLAARPAELAGRHVVLLDITKARGDEFLDRVEQRLRRLGVQTSRARKQAFSRPAAPDLIEEIALRGDLVVEGLAD